MSVLTWLCKCFSASSRAEHAPAGPTTSPPPGGPIQQVFSPSAVARAQPETPESCTSGAAEGAQAASVSQHGLDPAPTVPEEQQQRSLQQTVQHGGSQSLVELVASEALQAGSSAGGEHGQARSAPQEMGQPLDPRIRVPFNEIRLYSVIGKGGFKTVYRGAWNNTHVAVVAMRRGGLVAEARLLQRLSTHPNLVQLYRWSADESGNEYLVMELLPLGSLDAVLRCIGRQLLTQTKMTVVEQLASACLELAHEGLIHGDLAARNLLVKSLEPPHVKLADFGLSRPAAFPGHELGDGPSSPDAPMPAAPNSVVPARWAAPEVLAGEPPSEAADVWSFGMVCWEIFSNGAEPYASLSNREILHALRSGYRLERPRGCPLELWGLVQSCWRDEPRERPSFTTITTTLRNWREAYVSSRVALRGTAAAGSQAPLAAAAGLPSEATLPILGAGGMSTARGRSGGSAALQPGGHAPGTDLLSGARASRVPPAGAAPRGVARPPLAAPSPAAAAGAAGGGSSTWRQTPSSPPLSPKVPTFEPPTLSPAPLLSRALAGEAAGEPQGFALRGVLPALVTGESGTGSPRGDAAASTGFLTPTGATAADGTSGSVTGGMGLWAAAGPHTGRAGRGPSGVHMSTHMSFELGEPPIQPVLDTASSTQVSSTNALPTPPISLSNAGAAAAAPSLDAAVADLAVVPQLTADASPQQPLQDVRLVSGSAVVGVASSSPSNVMGQVLGPAAASQLPPPAAPTGLGGAGSGAGRDSNTRSTILSGVRDSSRPSDSPRSGDMFSARAGGLYSGRADAGWGGQRHALAAFGLASGPDGSAAGAAGRSGLYHTGAAAVDRQRLDRSFSSDCQPGVTPEHLMQQQLAGAAAAAAAAAAATVGALHVRGAAAAVLDTSPYVRIRDLTLPALPPAAAAAVAGTLVGMGAPLTPIRGDQADINAGGNAEALAFLSRRQARIPREQQRPRTAAAAEAAMASLPRDSATTAGALSPSPEGPFSVGAPQQGQQHQMQPDRIPQEQSASPQERVTVVAVQPLGAGGIGVGGVGSSTTEDLSLSNMPQYTSSAGTFAFASAQRRSSAQALGGRPSAAGTESTATLFGPPIGSTHRLPFGVFCLPSGAHHADQTGVSTSQLSISRVQQLQPETTLQGLGGQAFRGSVVAEHENEGVDETEEEDTAKLEAVPISVDAPRSHDEPVPLSHPRPLQAPAGSTASAVGLQEYHRPHPASITAVAVADAIASAASAAAAAAAVVRLSSANAAVVDVEAEARPDLPTMLAAARCSAGEPAVRGEAQAIAAAPAGASQHLSLGPGDHDEAETMSEEWAMAEVSATISRTGINGGPSSSRQEGASLGRAPSAMATGAVPSGSSAVGTGVSFALADAGEEAPAIDGGVTSYGNTSALAASLASDLRMSAASRLHVLQPTPSRLRASARRHDTEDAQRQSGSESPAQGCTPSPSPPPVQQTGSLTLVRQRMPLVPPATSAVLASVRTRRRRRGSNGSSRTSGSYRCRSQAGSVASSYASSRSRQRVGGQSSNNRAATAVAAGAGPGTASDTAGGLQRTATGGRAGGPTTAGLGTATAVAPAFLLGTAPAGLEGWRYGPLSPSSLSSRSARTVVSTLHSSWSGLLYVGPELAGAPAPVPQTAPASGMEAAAAGSGQAADGAAGEGAQARHDHARAKPGGDAARLSSREVRGTAGTATAPTHLQLPAPQLGPGSGGGDGAVATASTLSGGQLLSTEQSGSGRVRQGAAAAARGSRDSQGTGGAGITASTGTGMGMLVGRSGGFMQLLQELPLSGSDLMPGASASSVPFALPSTGIADASASNAGTAGTNLTGAAGAVPSSPPGSVGVPVRPVGAGGGDALGVGSMAAAGVVMGAGQGPAGPRPLFVARGYAAAPLYGSVDAPASPSSGAATAAPARLVPPGTGAGPGSGVPSAPDVVRTGLVTGRGGTSGTEGGGAAMLPGVVIDGQMEAGGSAGGIGVGPSAGLYGTAVTGSCGFVMMPGSSGQGSRGVLSNYAGPLLAQQAAGASVTSPFTPAAVAAAARAAGGMTAGAGVPAGTAGGAHYTVHNPALVGGAAAGGGSGIDGGVTGLQALLRRRTSTMLVTPPLTAAPSAASHDYLVMRTLGSTAVDEGGGGARGGVPPSLGAGLPSPSAGVPGNVAERLAAYRADALPVAAQLPMTADATGQHNTNFGAAELAAWLAGAGASSPGGAGSAGDGSSYGPLGPSCEAAAIAQLQQLHQQHQMRQFQQQQRQQQRLAQQQQDLPRRPQSLDLPERGAVGATSDTREPPYALAGPDAVATERVAIFAWMQQRHLDQLHEDRSW